MQIHELKPEHKFKKKKRVGRGGKRGTYSGKGMKGQKSRTGSQVNGMAEKGRSSWIKRFPKLGGFSSVYLTNIVVKSERLNDKFKDGDVVDPVSLKAVGLIGRLKRGKSGKAQKVKILNSGEIKKKLTVKGCLVSGKVKEMIEKAGGKVEEGEKKASKKKTEKKVKKEEK